MKKFYSFIALAMLTLSVNAQVTYDFTTVAPADGIVAAKYGNGSDAGEMGFQLTAADGTKVSMAYLATDATDYDKRFAIQNRADAWRFRNTNGAVYSGIWAQYDRWFAIMGLKPGDEITLVMSPQDANKGMRFDNPDFDDAKTGYYQCVTRAELQERVTAMMEAAGLTAQTITPEQLKAFRDEVKTTRFKISADAATAGFDGTLLMKSEGGQYIEKITITSAGDSPVLTTIDFYAAGEDGYYTTFSNDKAVTIPDMIEVNGEHAQFTVYSVHAEGDMLELQDLTDELCEGDTWYLSENEGYLIKAEYSGDVTYTGEKAFSVEYTELNYELNGQDDDNVLRPASEAKTGDNKYYMLAYSDDTCTPASIGFYWGAADGATFESRANSAYLALPKTTQARGFRFSGNEATAIKNIENKISNNVVYNLNGQRVTANAKGIVIVNGKKMLNK